MSRTTGPILAAGGITLAVGILVHDRGLMPFGARVAVATGIAASGFYLLEQLSPGLAVPLAWLALTTVLLVRLDPKTPAPIEAVADWINKG